MDSCSLQHSPIVVTPSTSVSPIPASDYFSVNASPGHIRSSSIPLAASPTSCPSHRWSDYTPYTLPCHEIQHLLRAVARHLTASLRLLTVTPETHLPDVNEVRQFVEWMCCEGKLCQTLLVPAVTYVRTFATVVADTECVAYNWHSLVATALMLASKIVEDDPLYSKELTSLMCDRLFGVYSTRTTIYKDTLKALNQTEIRFVEALDYRLHITHETYTELWRMLADDSPSDPHVTSPTSVVGGVHSLVPCTKPNSLQLLKELCTSTVRGWFANASPRVKLFET